MRILICDDDKRYCEEVKRLLLSNMNEDSESAIEILNSGKELVSYCLHNEPDILFMDIELGDVNGIVLAKHLRTEFPSLIIVYISSYPEYVFSCFETEPLNFLRKPLNNTEFGRTFDRVINKYTEIHKTIPIKWQHDSINLEIKDICYIEGYNRHLVYHLYNGDSYEVVGRLEDVYKNLSPLGFIKTHQGYVANMLYINKFGENEIYMKNGDTVLLSVRRRLKAKEAYFTYISRRN